MIRLPLLFIFGALFIQPLRPTNTVDGDTFDGTVDLRPGLHEDVRVRMQCPMTDGGAYYNAPELRADGGLAAKIALAAFLDGGTYTLHTEWKHDKYGRLLAEPFRATTDGGEVGFCPR